jgi:hypothetical protein
MIRWDQVTTEAVHNFIAPGCTPAVGRLLRNSVHAASLPLVHACLYAALSPTL